MPPRKAPDYCIDEEQVFLQDWQSLEFSIDNSQPRNQGLIRTGSINIFCHSKIHSCFRNGFWSFTTAFVRVLNYLNRNIVSLDSASEAIAEKNALFTPLGINCATESELFIKTNAGGTDRAAAEGHFNGTDIL